MNINKLTIKEAADLLEKGDITSVDLTTACLDRIKKIDGQINACLLVCEKEALEEAKNADERRRKGEGGLLLGIPYLAKDNILTKGLRTTAASKILENYIAPFDATIIKKLREAGAVLLGKTNLDEFAHGGSTENSAYGPTHNPYDLDRVPGGSSGGSAAAVAADMCIFALGTDTGGSIRQPASFCGVTGLKPSYGRGSRFGLVAMTSSTDVPGPIAKSVEDAAIIAAVISGRDEQDSTTVDLIDPEVFLKSINKDIRGLKIGLPKEYFPPEADANIVKIVQEAAKALESLGAEIVEVSLPHTKYGIPVYYIITPSEISSNLAKFDGVRYGFQEKEATNLIETYKASRGKGFGPEVKRRIMLGTYALSSGYYDAYYLQAQKVRTKIKEEMDDILNQVDCLLTPVAPNAAFKIGEKSFDPLTMYLEDIFMAPASLAGLPAIAIPAGFSEHLPIGIQLISKRFEEQIIFNIGNKYQQITQWHKKKPNL